MDPTFSYWSGFFQGHQMLMADVTPGYGYELSVAQRERADHDCRTAGMVCRPEQLLERAPGTGAAWIDVLSQDDVYIRESAPPALLEHLRGRWRELDQEGVWLHFRRTVDLPGRITVADGVTVEPDAVVGEGRIGQDMERYVVSTGSSDGRLVFWTTYWPGLQVTLDGEEVPARSLEGTLLQVDVPAGTEAADLVVRYEPVGARVLWPCLVAAPVLLALAVAGSLLGLRRTLRRRAAEVTGAAEEPLVGADRAVGSR
jgi:hypothetical protein